MEVLGRSAFEPQPRREDPAEFLRVPRKNSRCRRRCPQIPRRPREARLYFLRTETPATIPAPVKPALRSSLSVLAFGPLLCCNRPAEPTPEPSAALTAHAAASVVASPSSTGPTAPRTANAALDFVRSQHLDVARSETTVAQYRVCVDAGACRAPTTPPPKKLGTPWTTTWGKDRGDLPVDSVDWDDATRFCAWAQARLPTVEEWESLATNGGKTRAPWGDARLDVTRANYCAGGCDTRELGESGDDGFAGVAPVCSFPLGNNADGVCDLVGNLVEWTSSAYAFHPGLSKQARGASWEVFREWVNAREVTWFDATARGDTIGFRCVRDPR